MQTTIFYGNGVNLLSKNGKTRDTILREISVGQILLSACGFATIGYTTAVKKNWNHSVRHSA